MGVNFRMTTQQSIVIAGAGIFGLSAALELRGRGFSVTVVDPGPVPHPLAASNDVSRMIRMDYGDDKLYSDLGAEAIEGWHVWNEWRGKAPVPRGRVPGPDQPSAGAPRSGAPVL